MPSAVAYHSLKTNKKSVSKNELVNTPLALIRQCIGLTLPLLQHRRILDVGCDDGRWGKVIRETIPFADIDGLDLRDVALSSYNHVYPSTDFMDFVPDEGKRYDTIIGNPPFSLFVPMLEHARDHVLKPDGYIAWILPETYLYGIERSRIHTRHLSELVVFKRRVKWENLGDRPLGSHSLYIFSMKPVDRPPFIRFLDNQND